MLERLPDRRHQIVGAADLMQKALTPTEKAASIARSSPTGENMITFVTACELLIF